MHEGGVIAGFYGIGMYCNNTRLENKGGFLEYWGGGHKCDNLYPIWSELEYRLPACTVLLFCLVRGVGTGPADLAAAGPMFEPAFLIQLKTLPALFVKF